MNHLSKQDLLHLAEVLDAFRVFPRLFLLACFIWGVWVTDFLLVWYVHLSTLERTTETSGFAAIVQVGVLGFVKMVYGEYAKGGRDWGPPTAVTSTATTSVITQQVPP